MPSGQSGRPRDARLHGAILQTTRELLVDLGYAGLSMDGVASRAGVGKKTLYRRWPSKAPLVAEAVLDAYGGRGSFPVPHTGDLTADLRNWLVEHLEFVARPANAAMVRGIVAAAAADPDDQEELYTRLSAPQHDGLVTRLRAAIRTGELDAATDVDAVADAIVGALLLVVLTRRHHALPSDYADALVGIVSAPAPAPRRVTAPAPPTRPSCGPADRGGPVRRRAADTGC